MADQQDVVEFLKEIARDQNATPAIKQRADDLSKIAGAPIYQSGIWIYRSVVAVLGITVLATILGGLYLAFKGDVNYKLPSEIVAIGSAAIGALAGLLAPAPQQRAAA